jgi:hypothetical protein
MTLLFNRCLITRFYLSGLMLLGILCLTACAGMHTGGGEQELPTQREHNAFKAMILAQAEFNEEELLKFSEDLAATVDMSKEEAVDYLESVKGWPKNRSNYMVLKMGLASESIMTGKSYAVLFPIIPAELYPTRSETVLVRKHQNIIIPLFMPKDYRDAPDAAPEQS